MRCTLAGSGVRDGPSSTSGGVALDVCAQAVSIGRQASIITRQTGAVLFVSIGKSLRCGGMARLEKSDLGFGLAGDALALRLDLGALGLLGGKLRAGMIKPHGLHADGEAQGGNGEPEERTRREER